MELVSLDTAKNYALYS